MKKQIMASLTQKIKELITSEYSTALNEFPRGNFKAKTIAICSQKGGVGKTTTAVNLGSALVHYHDKKVLLADLDPQGHVEKSLAAMIEEGIDYTPLSEILLKKKGELLHGVVKTDQDNLHITPGDKSLYETEGQLASKLGREFILSNAIDCARTHYDYIIIDCPPNLGNLTINALCSADYVIIPCEMSVLAFEGVSDLLETLETITHRLNKKLKVLGVVFTRVDGRNIQMNKLVEDNMRQFFKGKIFKNQISVNTDLNKAQLEGESVFDFAPNSSGSLNYRALSDEIIKKLDGKKSGRVKKVKAKRKAVKH